MSWPMHDRKNKEIETLRAANAQLTTENTNMRENKFERGDLWNSHQALQAEVAQLTKERDEANDKLYDPNNWCSKREADAILHSNIRLFQGEIARLEARVKQCMEAIREADYQLGRIATADWDINQMRLAAESGVYRVRQTLAEPKADSEGA